MSVKVTLTFESVDQAIEVLGRIGAPVAREVVQTAAPSPVAVDSAPAAPTTTLLDAPRTDTAPSAEQPKPRKPRADAGRPRGSYKATGEPAASEPGNTGSASAPTSVPAAPASVAGPTAAAPTRDDARAALKRISDTKGMGTPACMQHLQEFGVIAISKLPPEQFALFIKQADEKVAQHIAAGGAK